MYIEPQAPCAVWAKFRHSATSLKPVQRSNPTRPSRQWSNSPYGRGFSSTLYRRISSTTSESCIQCPSLLLCRRCGVLRLMCNVCYILACRGGPHHPWPSTRPVWCGWCCWRCVARPSHLLPLVSHLSLYSWNPNYSLHLLNFIWSPPWPTSWRLNVGLRLTSLCQTAGDLTLEQVKYLISKDKRWLWHTLLLVWFLLWQQPCHLLAR